MSFEAKIIGVGFQKTGTSTLREALKILGYSVRDTCPRALIPILRGNYKKVLRMIRQYDALEDTPWYYIYKELDKLLPGSKYILTIRDEQSWLRSVSKHIGQLPAAHHEWIYGRGKGIPSEHPDNALHVYKAHNQEVMRYFANRPKDLLILDFTKGDGWEKLCSFLGKEVPDLPFPHYNKTSEAEQKKQGWKYHYKAYRHRTKNRIKIWFIDKMGWWT